MLVFVLDSHVVTTCEDLARQLRETLRSRTAHDRLLVVIAPQKDSAYVAIWLAAERISPWVLATSRDAATTVGGKQVVAPSVLIVDRTLRVTAGVNHLTKVTNTRPMSFASELNMN